MAVSDLENEREARRCPDHRTALMGGCEGCRAFRRWERQLTRSGVVRTMPAGPVSRKIRQLLDAGLTRHEIATIAGVGESLVRTLVSAQRHRGGRRRWVLIHNAEALLAITPADLPMAQRYRVNSVGTRRRMGDFGLRGIAEGTVATRLGYHSSASSKWHGDTVPGQVAAALKTLYEATLDEVAPPGRMTTLTIKRARLSGALPGRMWTPDTMDDPSYDPLAVDVEPIGVRRRLRSLARDGHGPAAVGALIGETAETVAGWTEDQPVPVYARHLVVDAYERLDTLGTDQAAADRAAHLGWEGWAAWYDVDIDAPRQQPKLAAPWGRRKSEVNPDYVNGALSGMVPRSELTQAELIEVVSRLARTKTSREIGDLLRWPSTSKSERGHDAVAAFASEHGIDLVASRERGFSLGPKYGKAA